MSNVTRRDFVKLTGGVAAMGAVGFPYIAKGAQKHVVIIGGGYGGAVAAKYIRMTDPSLKVTLVEKNKEYVSCPLSNPVIAGMRDISVQTHGYEGLKKHGVDVIHSTVKEIDPIARKVVASSGGFGSGRTLKYDRLIVSPGIDFKWGAIEGYDEAASQKMPHGWKAGPQTLLLRDQLQSLEDGQNFIIVAPPNPFRCLPGPYERASLVAHYLKRNRPKSKVIILDPKDKFSKFPLFRGGWEELDYPIEWVPGAEGGGVTRVDTKSNTVYTDMDEYSSPAINVIPPQQAGKVAQVSDLVDKSGWCPVHLNTFESTRHNNVHVIGDSSAAKGLPKSGYAANSEAKVCAAAVVDMLNGRSPGEPSYVNTCYSLLSPEYGISVAAVYRYNNGKIGKVSGGVSPKKASKAFRKQEAMYAESWYQSVMADTFS